MLRRVQVQEWQKVTQGDFNNFGNFPRDTFDYMLGDLGPGLAFAGFNCVQVSPAALQVGPGRLYTVLGPMFFVADTPGAEIDFLGQLPVVTRRWAAITVWGQEIETQTEPRTFLTDATTRATVARVTSTESRRHVNIAPVYSQESPDPMRPAIAQNTLAVAWVLLGPTGILQIIPAEENRATSLWRLLLRANDMDSWRTRIGSRLDTLTSDLANLAMRILNTAKLGVVLDLARDVARVRELVNLPGDYSAWSADHFLDTRNSETGHVDWLAKVEEGIRFPPAAERLAQIALLNQFDPLVIVQNNFMLPKYDHVARLANLDNEGEISLSQFEYQTTQWVELTRTRTRIRYGAMYIWCTNMAFRMEGGGGLGATRMEYDPVADIFRRVGTNETFQRTDGIGMPGGAHTNIRLQQFWIDELEENYWEQITVNKNFSGAIIAETFLNAQDGWLTSIDLYLTRVAGNGDIHVFIVETEHGAPEFDRVVGSTTVPVALLRTAPNATRASFVPIYLKQGRRYAFVLQTVGDHYSAVSVGNKYAQGMLFQSTAAQWAMGDFSRDLNFQLNFAQFELPRVAVQLTPLELQNGIAGIDLNFDSCRPPACSISFENQINGIWTTFGPSTEDFSNPLLGLPPLLPFRVILTGTTDVMPGIGVGPNGWSTTHRPRPDMRHISAKQLIPTPVDTVWVDVRLEAWRGAPFHVCETFLLTGDPPTETKHNPDFYSDENDPYDPMAIVRRYTFTFATPITEFRVRIEGWSDNVLANFHVAQRVQVSMMQE